jgi:SynChlorMet cassette radical SAM/SPASM protein ScmF
MSTPEPQNGGAPLAKIYFYLTEGCNLRCRHCWIMTEPEPAAASPSKAVLDLDLFASILEQARPLGLRSVKLTGGEPFLHPRIGQMLAMIQEAQVELVVETNGVLLTPELAARVASCPKPFVSVSLDGTDPETHEWVRQVPGSYQAALRGIRNLVQAGIRPQIIFTVMRKNRDQLGSIVSLAQELQVESVKFNVLQPSPRGDRMAAAGETLTFQEILETGRWVEWELAPSVDLPVYFSFPPAFKPLKRLFGHNEIRSVCGIRHIMGVLANGSYALCGIGSHIPELVFGHASRDKLADVWQTHPVLLEIREGLPQRLGGICRDCLMQTRCLGVCLAQNYYQTRDLWSPFWFCQQAEAAGLFPASRRRLASFAKLEKVAEFIEKNLSSPA